MNLFEQQAGPRLPFELPPGLGANVRWDALVAGFWIDLPRGTLFYGPQFFDQHFCDRSLDYLLANDTVDWRTANWKNYQHQALAKVQFKHVAWQHEQIFIYGQYRYQPRYTAWHGDAGAEYSYSGIQLKPRPWNACLDSVRDQVQNLSNTRFNSVLLNWYRDGGDAMGWHADNEPELGPRPTIASVSFGAERDFHLRSNDKRWKLSIPLAHGSVLLMQGELQQYWQHALPKRLRVRDLRLNLTFRKVQPALMS
jgi:alkylated DNA repair dioxygenase AlkB